MRIAFVVFGLSSFHLAYQYVGAVSEKIPTKGGTVVEGVIGNISYLPYTSTAKTDKFYQSLLFKGCVKASLSGGKIQYDNDLCEVTTRDFKNYFITLPNEYRWIDNTKFTTEDILFTYQSVLKDNMRKIEELGSYNKTEISRVDDATLKVSFPKQSVDNILFFLNPILPSHVLKEQTLDYYLKTFGKQPIYISCAVLDLVKSHDDNVVFNVTECNQYYPQILQVKQFKDTSKAATYLQSDKSIVDYILVDSAEADNSLQGIKGFSGYNLPTNTLYTLFFNVNTISENVRKGFANALGNINYTNLLYHKTLFSFAPTTGIILKDLISNQTSGAGTGLSSGIVSTFPFLPKNIWIFGKNKYKEYYLDEFRDKYLIQFKFDTKYDKITIAANSNFEFTPDSYDPETLTCSYNLSLQFKNIKKGINTYTIYGYLNGQQSKLLTMRLHYGVKPQSIPSVTKKTNFTLIYLNEPNSTKIVETLKQFFIDESIDNYINFIPYSNFTEFEGKLSSKAYDMVILPLDLGLKNDLSALFSDNTTLNPSQYSNDRLIELLQKFNNGNKAATNEILSLYKKVYPFVMLGSLKQTLYIKNVYPYNIDSQHTNITFRYQIINSLKTYETVILKKENIFSGANLIKFFQAQLGIQE
ncbi:MAG: hypothetical protein WC004_02835 [Candidatus Absconditabacterales bacterium]